MKNILVAGYFFLIIFRPFEVWPILEGLHLERLYTLGMLAYALPHMLKNNNYGGLGVSLVLVMIAMLLGGSLSDYSANSNDYTVRYIKMGVGFFIVASLMYNESDIKDLLTIFLVVMLLYVGKSAIEFFVHGRHVYRMGIVRMIAIDKTYSDPNSFGASMVYSLPFAYVIAKSGFFGRRMTMASYCYLGLVSVCIVFTGSRSALVCSLLYGAMLLWKSNHKVAKGMLSCVALVIVWDVMPEDYRGRFWSIVDSSEYQVNAVESANNRILHLKDGWRLFLEHPIFGIGIGNYPYYNAAGQQLHNLYGKLLGEMGLIGSMTYMTLIICLYRIIRQGQVVTKKLIEMHSAMGGNNDNDLLRFIQLTQSACLSVLLLLLVNGFFGHNLLRYTWWFVGAVALTSRQVVLARWYQLRGV